MSRFSSTNEQEKVSIYFRASPKVLKSLVNLKASAEVSERIVMKWSAAMKIILKFAMFLSYIGSPVLAQAGNEDRYRPILEQASDEYKLGNYKAAAKTFKKVYSKSPELKKPAFAGLIETLRSNKQWDEAIDVLKSEIQTSPFVSDYRIWLSEIYYSAGNYPAALHELAFAEKITGPNESVLKIRYQTQQKLGQHQEAIATITQYLEKQPKSYEALAARSSSYFELNLPGKAYADLQEGYKLRPFDEHIISNLTKVAYVLGRHGDVKIHGQKCMDQFPKNILCYESLGKSAFKIGDYPRAIRHFETVLTLNPNSLENRQALAESLAQNGNHAESDSHYTQILKMNPSYLPAMKSWAQNLNKRKNVAVLGERLLDFSSRRPEDLWAAVELSRLLHLVGNNDQAVATMKNIAKTSDSDTARIYYAKTLYDVGQYNEAAKAINEIKDETYEKTYHLGLISLKDKKLIEAIDQWQKVGSSSPLYFQAQFNTVLAYEQQGDFKKAKELLSALNPPTEYKILTDRKFLSLSLAEERKPATSALVQTTNEPTYFLEWKLPTL